MSEVASEAAPEPGPSSLSPRLALGAFIAYLAVAWWVLIFDLGADVWFLRDDWKFLSGRDGGSLHDIFRPHDVHPAALPVVVFRLMFHAFGLRYTPYLMLIVTMHLGLCAVLRVVMRRAGVGPWIATVAAGALVLFGPGEQNIHWAFQINFVGALLLGFAQLLLSDHDGRFSRRDVAGIVAGMAAVMCSGIGPFIVASVGVATLVRRGWRIALAHTVPPALTYVTWVLLANPAEYDYGRPALSVVWDWVREGQIGTVAALGHHRIIAILLVVLLVGGLGLFITSTPFDERRQRAAITGALLVCGPLFFVLTAQGRWVLGLEQARSSRYIYIGAVCLLPALALAGDAVARRWRPAAIVVIALFMIGVPGNIGEFGNSVIWSPRFFEIQRQVALGVPRTPEAEQVPRWVRPLPDRYNGEDLTIGWLLDARDSGRLPKLADPDPRVVAKFPIILGLAQVLRPFSGEDCATRTAPIDLDLEPGDEVGIDTAIKVATVADGERTSPWVAFSPGSGSTLSVELSVPVLRFAPETAGKEFTLCR